VNAGARDFEIHRVAERAADETESLPRGEWIPGAGNLLLRFDAESTPGDVARAQARLDEIVRNLPSGEPAIGGRVVEVPVRFGGADGEDLAPLAREIGLPEPAIVERLCAAELTVAFLGFAPGFPYLIGLPAELEVPRLASPRPRVPVGSVAIAGPFAGIYPSSTPGGWRLLGRTDLDLFDVDVAPPARFVAGDRVRLVPA